MFRKFQLMSLAVLLAIPSVAVAQTPGAQNANVRATPASGPRLNATATAIRQPRQDSAKIQANAVAQRQSMGKPVAMMIVGAAAFVAGALIGDAPGTLMMIGGAVIGLIGLYEYLK